MRISINAFLFFGLFQVYCFEGLSQKGLPPKIKTSADVATNFPQHQEFIPALLNRLKVAEGFTLTVAASGLGKPRMMEVPGDGAL